MPRGDSLVRYWNFRHLERELERARRFAVSRIRTVTVFAQDYDLWAAADPGSTRYNLTEIERELGVRIRRGPMRMREWVLDGDAW